MQIQLSKGGHGSVMARHDMARCMICHLAIGGRGRMRSRLRKLLNGAADHTKRLRLVVLLIKQRARERQAVRVPPKLAKGDLE